MYNSVLCATVVPVYNNNPNTLVVNHIAVNYVIYVYAFRINKRLGVRCGKS